MSVRLTIETYIRLDSCDSEHRTRHWGLDSIQHQIAAVGSCRISNAKTLRYIAKKKNAEYQRIGKKEEEEEEPSHWCKAVLVSKELKEDE